jgi:arabinan endo-1,5-alpha-L-arabinosidase
MLRGTRGRGIRLALAAALVALAAPVAAHAYPNPMPTTQPGAVDKPAVDPSLVIRSGAPKYVLLSTGDNNLTSYSTDRLTWTPGVATMLVPPVWWETETLNWYTWAPDISFHNGKYWLYYVRARPPAGHHDATIGVATSSTGDPGTWIDGGKVVSSRNDPATPDDPSSGDRYRALDPNLFVDTDGKWYVLFGSFWDGIFIQQADQNSGKLLYYANLVNIAARPGPRQWERPIEAPFLFKRGGYYYLFVSFGYCCKTPKEANDYHIRVGRSTSPTGPYVDKAGVDMRSGGGSVVLDSHDPYVFAPGGQSVVHDPNTGQDLLVYHYYDKRVANWPKALGINKLDWDAAGWPVVQ